LIGRIGSRDEFIRIRREGRRVRLDPLWCAHVVDDEAEMPFVAFAINRSVGNAVIRNRLRRRMRAVLDELDLPAGWFLIGCRPAAGELTFDEIRDTLGKLPQRLTPTDSTAPRSR